MKTRINGDDAWMKNELKKVKGFKHCYIKMINESRSSIKFLAAEDEKSLFTCRNRRSASLIAWRMASLLRSLSLVSPLQKRASTDLISQLNRISGYKEDMARPCPEQMQGWF